jgi:hypothetical protein
MLNACGQWDMRSRSNAYEMLLNRTQDMNKYYDNTAMPSSLFDGDAHLSLLEFLLRPLEPQARQ